MKRKLRRARRRKDSFARKKPRNGHILVFFRAKLAFLGLCLRNWLFFVPRDDIHKNLNNSYIA